MSRGARRRGAKNSKGRYHPTRTSGIQKQMRARVVNEMAKRTGKAKHRSERLNPDHPDWTLDDEKKGR